MSNPTPGAEPPPPDAAPPADAPPATPYPRNVVALGVTSLFTDVSTEMIIPVLPLFVTATLGAPVAILGLIEGAAESAASLLRLGSGWLSDRVGKRKPFLVFGYGISTFAKAGFAFVGSWPALLGFRLADRLGKGLRNPPRDALIADSVRAEFRGRAFGFHRALDTVGAAIGPLVAFALLAAWPGDYRRVFAATLIPGILSVATLMIFVRAKPHVVTDRPPLARAVRSLGSPFRRFVIADTVFQLGNSTIALVLLRAKSGGMLDGFLPLAYVVFNVVSASLAVPFGALSDRFGRRGPILAGYLVFAATYALLAMSDSPSVVVAALVLLGVHAALLAGAQRGLIADLVPADRRATAYGVHHTATGLALLPASAVAGWLWDVRGASTAFALDAALAGLAALLLVVLLPSRGRGQDRIHDAAS